MKIGLVVSGKFDFLIFQNLFFLCWYSGWIYYVGVATYPRNMDQIRAGAPRSYAYPAKVFSPKPKQIFMKKVAANKYFESLE